MLSITLIRSRKDTNEFCYNNQKLNHAGFKSVNVSAFFKIIINILPDEG